VHEIAQRELYPASVPAGFQAGPGVRGVFAGGTARGPVVGRRAAAGGHPAKGHATSAEGPPRLARNGAIHPVL